MGSISRRPGPAAGAIILRVRIDYDTRPLLPGEARTRSSIFPSKTSAPGRTEIFRNVSVTPGNARRVDTVLENDSHAPARDDGAECAAGRHAAILAGENPDPFSDAFPARYTVDRRSADQADDGDPLTAAQITDPALEATKQGMYALVDADLFNLLCIPPHKLSSAPDPSNSDLDPSHVIDVADGLLRRASRLS